MDLLFGVTSFAGPVGAGLGTVYFASNFITTGITGRSIGEHVDEHYFVMPGVIPGSPIMLIPK